MPDAAPAADLALVARGGRIGATCESTAAFADSLPVISRGPRSARAEIDIDRAIDLIFAPRSTADRSVSAAIESQVANDVDRTIDLILAARSTADRSVSAAIESGPKSTSSGRSI